MLAKKKVAIFKGDTPTEVSTAHRIYRELREHGPDDYYIENLADIMFVIRGREVTCMSLASGRSITDYDLLYIRGTGHPPIRHAVALCAADQSVQLLSEESHYFQHETKLTQYIALALGDVPVPDTVFATRTRIAQAAASCGTEFPVVVKAINASNGEDNLLVQAESELKDIPFEYPVIQPFIPNNFDYRVIVAGGEVMLTYERIRTDATSYKNNVKQGAVRKLVKRLPHEVRAYALRAASIVRRDLCGVDIVRNKLTGAYYVLEVNNNFGVKLLPDGIGEEIIARLAIYLHRQAIL